MRRVVRPFLRVSAAALAGAASWCTLEYFLHRFVMHELRGKGRPSRAHLEHHADTTHFASTGEKAATAVAVVVPTFPVAVRLVGAPTAAVYVSSFVGTYLGYEVLHRWIHVRPPRTAYGRWARRNHLRHHYGRPMSNQGVTLPVWDIVFGTADTTDGPLRVPRRMAPVWLIDGDGTVRPEYASDYVLAGKVRTAAIEDRRAAFSNTAPAD